MYTDEIAFIERKLIGKKVQWKAIQALEQIASADLSKFDALNIVDKLKTQLEEKCKKRQKLFTNIVAIFKETTVVIKVPALREVFGDEIDGFSGGGGRKMRVNPLSTTMRR
jgi:hypothetical protein